MAEGEDLDKGDYRLALEGSFARDFVFSRQIRSAALSVPSNIAEGFERGDRNEFHQFLSIAKSSAAEVRSDLYTTMDIGYLEEKRFAILLRDGDEVSRIIGGLRRAVDQQRHHKSQSPVLSPEFAPVAEFGRRTGLKIPSSERSVPVRVRPGAPRRGKHGKACEGYDPGT